MVATSGLCTSVSTQVVVSMCTRQRGQQGVVEKARAAEVTLRVRERS